MQVDIREAKKDDLIDILNLYKQPDMDDGKVLSQEQAEKIFDRILSYPNYKVFVAIIDEKIIGTFALAVMDNLAHMGAPSGLIEDVVVKTEY